MYEINDFIRRQRKLATAIIRHSTGKYSLVGSVPIELTHLNTKSLTPDSHSPNIYDTEQQVIDALLALGIRHYQLSNCKWY